jgi:hypothetical protein
MATVAPAGTISDDGNPAWRYVGLDDRGRELEVVAVEIGTGPEAFLLVIHVMPTSLRGRGDPSA